MAPVFVLSGDLRLPPNRSEGADPFKLAAQIAEFGASADDLPPLQVTQGKNGELMINDGVTRATRMHLRAPKQAVPVEIIDVRPDWDFSHLPFVKETLP